jgi:hypothetical protein
VCNPFWGSAISRKSIDIYRYALTGWGEEWGTKGMSVAAIEAKTLDICLLKILTNDVMHLHVDDHTRITPVAPGTSIVFCQCIVKGPARVVVNPINHTTKLGIGVGIINICDGDSYTRITLDILVFLASGCVCELEMFTIPQKPHGG